MASTSDIAKRYFAALGDQDLDEAIACWKPGAVDRLVGAQDLVAPDGIRRYFSELFSAFPDFDLEVLELTTARKRTAVRWRARGTFAGPGTFQGFAPNHGSLVLEGCDVVTVADDLIVHNDAYIDSGDIARQLGLLPPAGSTAEARLIRLANTRTKARRVISGVSVEPVADGVWVVRGGFPLKVMNVSLIRDGDGVTVFDAGFEVVELPGHAPGLIGLFRRSDRVALVSDCFYTLDIQTGRKGGPRIPPVAFDADVEQARASIRKLAALEPDVAWAGHADPVTGDVRGQLERVAEAPA